MRLSLSLARSGKAFLILAFLSSQHHAVAQELPIEAPPGRIDASRPIDRPRIDPRLLDDADIKDRNRASLAGPDDLNRTTTLQLSQHDVATTVRTSFRNGNWLLGDFTGDGRTDATFISGSEMLSFHWRSRPFGTFQTSIKRLGFRQNAPSTWMVQDADADGKDDIIQVVHGEPRIITWLSRDITTEMTANFDMRQMGPEWPTSTGAWLPLDFDGDGRGDLLHVPAGGATVSTLRSRGDGKYTLSRQQRPRGATGDKIYLVGDLNGDGRGDVIHVENEPNGVQLWLSRGDGQFDICRYTPGADYRTSSGVWRVGDFNGDGMDDLVHLVLRTNDVNAWISNGDASFRIVRTEAASGYKISNGDWIVGDLNNDGRDDLLHAVANARYAHAWMAGADNRFQVSGPIDTHSDLSNSDAVWVAGAIDNDGRADFFRGVRGGRRLEVIRSLAPPGPPAESRNGIALLKELRPVASRLSRDCSPD